MYSLTIIISFDEYKSDFVLLQNIQTSNEISNEGEEREGKREKYIARDKYRN